MNRLPNAARTELEDRLRFETLLTELSRFELRERRGSTLPDSPGAPTAPPLRSLGRCESHLPEV